MWCFKLFLAPLPFASNVNLPFLIPFKELGNQLSSSSVQSWGAADAPFPSPQPQGGLCHHSLLGFGPFHPVWRQLERDALVTLRGQPHFTSPQHPLPHSVTGCSALCGSMPASGCFSVTTGPGKSHWLSVIVSIAIKQ